jgi:hypothetical protein
MDVELDVKDMTKMVMLELLYRAARPEIPNFDHLIVARAYEASRSRVKGEGTHKRVVSNKGA